MISQEVWVLDYIDSQGQVLGYYTNELTLRPRAVGQGWKDMAPALNAIETLVLQRQLCHPDLLNWCVENAVALSDPAGNRKLDKSRSISRIDGLVAAVMDVGLSSAGAL